MHEIVALYIGSSRLDRWWYETALHCTTLGHSTLQAVDWINARHADSISDSMTPAAAYCNDAALERRLSYPPADINQHRR